MNKAICVIVFSLSTLTFSATRWGIPTYLDFAAYAVNDYESISDLPRSIGHKDRFISQMQGKVEAKYPNVIMNIRYNRENANATVFNYLNDNTNGSEIVFSAGHGWYDGVWMYDGFVSSSSGKRFGNWTRWVFFDACLALNTSLTNAARWFNGAHAILGNRSNGWQYIRSYDCFFSCSHYRSEDQYNKFAQRFITNGEEIWPSYYNAVKEAIYQNGGLGIETAIINLAGNADNGQYVDFSQERFQNVYNGPFTSANGASNIVFWARSVRYGTPKYGE